MSRVRVWWRWRVHRARWLPGATVSMYGRLREMGNDRRKALLGALWVVPGWEWPRCVLDRELRRSGVPS